MTYTPLGLQRVASLTLTRPANTTAYASGYLVANSTTAGSVVATEIPNSTRFTNESLRIEGLTLRKSSTTLTNASFRVYILQAQPASFSVGDGAAFDTSGALGISSVSGIVGYFDVTMSLSGTAGAVGWGTSMTGSPFPAKPDSGTSLWFVIEARAAYGPASGETFTVELEGQWS